MYIYCTEVKQEIAIRKFANFIMKSKDTTRRQILPPAAAPCNQAKNDFFDSLLKHIVNLNYETHAGVHGTCAKRYTQIKVPYNKNDIIVI